MPPGEEREAVLRKIEPHRGRRPDKQLAGAFKFADMTVPARNDDSHYISRMVQQSSDGKISVSVAPFQF